MKRILETALPIVLIMLPILLHQVLKNTKAYQSFENVAQLNSVDVSQRINQANDCDESGNGDNLATCTNLGNNAVGPITQTNSGHSNNNDGDANYKNAVDIDQAVNQLNDCDEEDDGNNAATCTNLGNNAVGPITQTNSGHSNNNDGDANYKNAVDISQRINQANGCSESGDASFLRVVSSSGEVFPGACTNLGNNAVGPITQTNSGHSNNNDGDANYKNAVDIDQAVNQLNDCDENEDFANFVGCDNSGSNSIGPITQTNSGHSNNNDGDANYKNAVDISQRINQANDCDESEGIGLEDAGFNGATCTNLGNNAVGPITQTNSGHSNNNDGDANYKNAVDIDQAVNQLNDCDEEDGGFNQAICTNLGNNAVGPITQTNSGHSNNNDGDANYKNAVDISQRINQANDCDESGFGDLGFQSCVNIGNNAVGPITQTNSGHSNNNDGDANYKNAVDIDQAVNQLNDCDESGAGNLGGNACQETLVNNPQRKPNSGFNSIGIITQTNQGFGINNDGDANYKNAVDIDQAINQANNCDELGGAPLNFRTNQAICNNSGSNSLGDITQVNQGLATNIDGDANYKNAVVIDQAVDQANRCSEFDNGQNNAECENTAFNTVGSIIQTNEGYTTKSDGSVIDRNEVDINQQAAQLNDCDESGDGTNLAQCNNQASNSIGEISQSNDGNGENHINIDQKTNQKNNCDENGAGDNNARCSNKASNSVGDISQSNDDEEEENEETNASEENDDSNDNDDNDKEDQKESGSNDNEDDDEKDIDVDQDVSQENDLYWELQ